MMTIPQLFELISDIGRRLGVIEGILKENFPQTSRLRPILVRTSEAAKLLPRAPRNSKQLIRLVRQGHITPHAKDSKGFLWDLKTLEAELKVFYFYRRCSATGFKTQQNLKTNKIDKKVTPTTE